eukprot:301005-Chlamydomonas_euryale.AAC.1
MVDVPTIAVVRPSQTHGALAPPPPRPPRYACGAPATLRRRRMPLALLLAAAAAAAAAATAGGERYEPMPACEDRACGVEGSESAGGRPRCTACRHDVEGACDEGWEAVGQPATQVCGAEGGRRSWGGAGRVWEEGCSPCAMRAMHHAPCGPCTMRHAGHAPRMLPSCAAL